MVKNNSKLKKRILKELGTINCLNEFQTNVHALNTFGDAG